MDRRYLRDRSTDPVQVRRWFKSQYGMTFHTYTRARRLGQVLGRIRHGHDLTDAAYEHGYGSVSGFRDAFNRLFGEPPGRSRSTQLLVCTRLLTLLGPMVVGARDDGLYLLAFADRPMLETRIRRLRRMVMCVIAPGENEHIAQIDQELEGYFVGTLQRFRTPILLLGMAFQRSAWGVLQTVPFGRTSSYKEIACRIGRPLARRAVGRANGDNRLAIVVPCHRIIAAAGSLTVYGGGLWRKQFLLNHERSQIQQSRAPLSYAHRPDP